MSGIEPLFEDLQSSTLPLCYTTKFFFNFLKMKKQNHPKKFQTIVIQKDGSSYHKTWLVKKKFFELDFDLTNHSQWKWKKSIISKLQRSKQKKS